MSSGERSGIGWSDPNKRQWIDSLDPFQNRGSIRDPVFWFDA
jgi:hypothetical protein